MTEPGSPRAEEQDGQGRHATFEYLGIASLFVAAFAVRLWGMPHMHGWDEDVYLQNAELICCGKTNFNEIDSRPPLLSLIYAGVFLLWHSDYAAWIVTALLNALGPVFLYLGGRAFVGRVSAGIAAVLLAFLPFLVDADRSLLSDGPALTMIVLSFWLLVRALEKETDIRFAVAGFAMALSVLMRFGSLSSVGMLSLLVLAAHRKRRSIAACGVGFAAGILPYLSWSRVYYGGYLATLQNGWVNFGGPAESPLYFVMHLPLVLSWVALAGMLLCAIRIAYEFRQRSGHVPIESQGGGSKVRLPGIGYLWLWALAVLCFFSYLDHKEVRYVIPATAPLLLLAGAGLSVLLKGQRPAMRAAGWALLTGALLFVLWPIHRWLNSGFLDHRVSEEMVVSDFLNRSVPSSTVLYINQNYPDFAYYTDFQVEPLPHDGPELYSGLTVLPRAGILVAYRKDDDGTPIGPDLAWVDANPHYHRLKEFPKLILYTYQP